MFFGDEKGAFDETLAQVKENTHRARIKHFKNHDPSQVPGVIKDFYIDDKGVVAVSQLATTTLGVDTLKEYEAGIITEHSQGFQIMDDNVVTVGLVLLRIEVGCCYDDS